MPSPQALVASLRDRRPSVDHLVRAASRYQADTGDRLAAAVTFFGFLSFFPLIALSVSLLALVLHGAAVSTVTDAVNSFSPGLADQLGLETLLQNNTRAGVTGLLSLAGLLLSGLGWVDALREAIRTVWHQNVKAGNFIKKKLADIVILAGLGAAFLLSLVVTAAASSFTGVALGLVGLKGSFVAAVVVKVLATLLAIFSSTVIFVYLFIRLPRVQTPWRKVVKGALLAAVLFEVLKFVGAFYISRTTHNPLYGTFAVVVGLLVWINLVSRMLLFCAAWTVTGPYDSDVAPSGTADAEQARKAGIPLEFADADPDKPPAVQSDGAPSPLLPALQGRTPSQDEPGGKPGQPEPEQVAARRARVPADSSSRADAGIGAQHTGGQTTGDQHAGDPYPGDPQAQPQRSGHCPTVPAIPGEVATRRVAQTGAALVSAGLIGVGVYAVRTVSGLVRR